MLLSFYLMEGDLWFLLGEIFFSLLLLFFIDILCLPIFLMHVFLHRLRLSKNSRAHDDVLHAANYATIEKEMLVLKPTIREGRGVSWFCPRPIGGQSVYLSRSSGPRTQAKLRLYLMLGENKFWFCMVPKWLPQVISFPTGLSPRTMQDLGSV